MNKANMDWNNHIRSSSKDEKHIIESIIKLHNQGRPFDVDPCYSIGRFWTGLPQPRLKFDIAPQVEGVVQASADTLPLENDSVHSVMFDPPFVVRESPSTNGKIANRFSSFKDIPSLWGFYQSALREFWRILQTGGIVAFKCQDTTSWHTQWMSHYEIMKYAEEIGYYFQDLFILTRDNVMFSPNMAKQQNARKNHCYFIVLRKPNKPSKYGASSKHSLIPLYRA